MFRSRLFLFPATRQRTLQRRTAAEKYGAGHVRSTPLTGRKNPSVLEIERRIGRSVVVDKKLSTYAHRVKIVATNGNVTLKGPVWTKHEKPSVAAKAEAFVFPDRIRNQIEIAPQ